MPLEEKIVSLVIFTVVVGVFSLVAASSSGCSGWFLYVFLMPFYKTEFLSDFGRRLGRSGGAGGGWSSDGWSGGGFSGGGFSGGGSSFDGGGASGSW